MPNPMLIVESEPLPPFNEAAICVKCGGNDVHARHVETDYYHYSRRCRERGEHIDRHCRRCGYEWPERCLDR